MRRGKSTRVNPFTFRRVERIDNATIDYQLARSAWQQFSIACRRR